MDACEKCKFIYVKCSFSINKRDHYHKMGKKIYGHEQCVVCVTLKIQVTPHFSHNLLGLVHSCSILQCPLNCFPSLLGMYVQLVVYVHVNFPHHCFMGDLLTFS